MVPDVPSSSQAVQPEDPEAKISHEYIKDLLMLPPAQSAQEIVKREGLLGRELEVRGNAVSRMPMQLTIEAALMREYAAALYKIIALARQFSHESVILEPDAFAVKVYTKRKTA